MHRHAVEQRPALHLSHAQEIIEKIFERASQIIIQRRHRQTALYKKPIQKNFIAQTDPLISAQFKSFFRLGFQRFFKISGARGLNQIFTNLFQKLARQAVPALIIGLGVTDSDAEPAARQCDIK